MTSTQKKPKPVRVRIAPSPTGFPHIGNLRTAIYNYLLARKEQGSFILRIEDTDQKRLVAGSEAYLQEALDWMGMVPDESPWQGGPYGPYRQSERKAIYRPYALDLVKRGLAYYAFDTAQDLEAMRTHQKEIGVASPKYNAITRMTMQNSLTLSAEEVARKIEAGDPYVIRMKISPREKIKFKDEVRGWIEVEGSTLDDKVLFKSDGMPTYHLASVVDDHLMEISHVIRGEEWLPSTPLHYLLYKAFGWEAPQFVHLPLILRPDGMGKLSKRTLDGNMMILPISAKDPITGEVLLGFREAGYFPQAFVNFLALMGWHPHHDQEVFTLSELIAEFSIERIKRAGIRFDMAKATWLNGQYLRKCSDDKLLNEYLKPALQTRGISASEGYMRQVLALVKERAVVTTELWAQSEPFFQLPKKYDHNFWEGEKWKVWRPLFDMWREELGGLADWMAKPIQEVLKSAIKKAQMKVGEVMPLLRMGLLGTAQGPHIADIMQVLGRDETLKRLDLLLAKPV